MNQTLLPTILSMPATQSGGAALPGPEFLVRVPFFLEAPSYLMEARPLPNPVPRWFINAGSMDATLQKLATLGVPQSLLNASRTPGKFVQWENRVILFPAPGDLAALNPALRAAVYQVLREFPGNDEMVTPFVFSNRAELQRWFADTQIRPELISLIEQFAYPWTPGPGGNALAFSDIAVLMGQTRGEGEARQVMRALYRTPTLQLKIAIQPGEDPARLAATWAPGHRDRGWRASSLISSWCHAKEADLFDVTHLLPRVPRMLLYTFPTLSMGMGGTLPGAHWTTRQFFGSELVSADSSGPREVALVTEGLAPVDGHGARATYQFGDVLVYWSQLQQRMVHSCVYLADGVVFTKNSPELTSPWVLQEWDVVKNRHLSHPGDRIQGYRKLVAGVN